MCLYELKPTIINNRCVSPETKQLYQALISCVFVLILCTLLFCLFAKKCAQSPPTTSPIFRFSPSVYVHTQITKAPRRFSRKFDVLEFSESLSAHFSFGSNQTHNRTSTWRYIYIYVCVYLVYCKYNSLNFHRSISYSKTKYAEKINSHVQHTFCVTPAVAETTE